MVTTGRVPICAALVDARRSDESLFNAGAHDDLVAMIIGVSVGFDTGVVCGVEPQGTAAPVSYPMVIVRAPRLKSPVAGGCERLIEDFDTRVGGEGAAPCSRRVGILQVSALTVCVRGHDRERVAIRLAVRNALGVGLNPKKDGGRLAVLPRSSQGPLVVVRRIAVNGLESPSRMSNTMCARARQHRERCKEHEGAMQERERPWTLRLPASRGKGSDP